MNKTELITNMANKANLTKKDAEAALNAFVEIVEDTVAAGDKVALVGFGTFEPRLRAAREGRNPKTKEVIQIAESIAPVFKAGKEFKEKVNA